MFNVTGCLVPAWMTIAASLGNMIVAGSSGEDRDHPLQQGGSLGEPDVADADPKSSAQAWHLLL